MVGKGPRKTLSLDRGRLAAESRVALARLSDACNHARKVMAEAVAILERSGELPHPLFSATVHATVSATEKVHVAADVAALPHWDRGSRVLSLSGRVVKRYRVPSPNQEAVLAAFEEEGWPHRIDDPLRFQVELGPKYRLHYTIRRLNRSQQQRLIRFFGDGTGVGVCWQLTEALPVSTAQPAEPWHEQRRAA